MAQVEKVTGTLIGHVTRKPLRLQLCLLCHSRQEALNHENPQVVRAGGTLKDLPVLG